MSTDWGIPALRLDRLAEVVPDRVYGGGPIADPTSTLFVWRTCRFPATARDGVLGFYTDDYRFECLWRQAERYAEQFRTFGWGAVIEPDFSLWANAPLVEQMWNVYRTRSLGRLWQDAGLQVIPSLNWSDERSFSFCFQGIPQGAPVVATECRTPGSCDDDRRAFLRGLAEGVKQIRPQHVCIYGGVEHHYWLERHLPPGPKYRLLESWHGRRHVNGNGSGKQSGSNCGYSQREMNGYGWTRQ